MINILIIAKKYAEAEKFLKIQTRDLSLENRSDSKMETSFPFFLNKSFFSIGE